MAKKKYPKCPVAAGCVKRTEDGSCVSLHSTAFGKTDYCPFYKTADQAAQEEKAKNERLHAMGLDHLIKKTYSEECE